MTAERCVIFYSWQTDLPNATNRGFIEKALEQTAKTIRNDDSIQVEPVIERDTLGVAGAPNIAETIFGKIDQAHIFVADISIINQDATSPDGAEARPTPNPNVLLELGYALKTMGDKRIILVLNDAYGGPELLPFDLRMRRVIRYHMPTEAEERATERKRLEETLAEGIRTILSGQDAPQLGEVIQPSQQTEQERQTYQAALLQRTGAVRKRGILTYQHYRPEMLNETPLKQRWPRSEHLYFDLIPCDGTADIFSFTAQKEPLLDQYIPEQLRKDGWYIREDQPDDIFLQAEGLGIIVFYHGKRTLIKSAEIPAQPVSTLYFDRTGGVFVVLPTASLGSVQPPNDSIDPTEFTKHLLMRLGLFIQRMFAFLREQGYEGRVQATLWIDRDPNLPPQQIGDAPLDRRFIPEGVLHHGQTVFAITEPWEAFSKQLTQLVNQVMRSYLQHQFIVPTWLQGAMPEVEIRS